MEKIKSVFITGANRGIGFELVKKFAFELGYKVYMGCRDIEKAQKALSTVKNNGNIYPIIIDVSDEKSVKNAYNNFLQLKSEDEELFVLINNAGIGLDHKPYPVSEFTKTFDIDIEVLDKIYRVNAFGAILVSKYFSQSMAAYGRIINVASGVGEYWYEYADIDTLIGYASSKSALLMINKKIAAALRDKPIYVNAACPGHCRTELGGSNAPQSIEEGADSIIKAAFLDKKDNILTGKFYRNGMIVPIDVYPYLETQVPEINRVCEGGGKTKLKFLETIFSVKNDFNKKHKVITILGFKMKFQKKFLDKFIEDYKIMHDKSLYVGIPDDLNLQLSFNNDCNCKCKFCSEKIERDSKKRLVIPEKWLYEYLKPLYPKMSNLIPTYGEITFCREGYEYLRYIHDNYPQINIFIETNGIAFDEKWAQLASDNLMRVNFSINAIDEEHFKKTVWEKDGVYPVIEKNIQRYLDVLKEKNLFAFKPSVSCVINSTNYDTTVEFIRKYISQGIQYVIIYFDLIENNTWGGVMMSQKMPKLNKF